MKENQSYKTSHKTPSVFSEENISKKSFDDRWVKFAFGPQGLVESKKFNLGIVEFDKNKISKTHIHDVEEVLYVISGKGKIKLGDNTFELKEKDFVYIPEGTEHTIITDSKSKLKILFMFSDKIVIER